MNIRIVIVLFGLLSLNFAQAQNKIFTKTGRITFDATGNLEKIQGVNKKVTCAVDKSSGAVEFAALMKAFQFEKALMEEHFNDNYVESDKFPKATFKGRITNAQAINWSKDGKYSANVEGDLTIHGVTKKIASKGTFVVDNGVVSAKSSISINLKDYGIEIPALVKENISEKVSIDIDVLLNSVK